jgi:hypothetical protein
MASGRLGAADLAATTNTLICTGSAGTRSTININVCNRNSSEVTVRLAIEDGATGTPANEDYIEYDAPVPANDVLERTAVVLTAGHSVIAYSSTANVSVMVWGMEGTA